jgi:hypothetical protein
MEYILGVPSEENFDILDAQMRGDETAQAWVSSFEELARDLGLKVS